ncbi:MAG: hypothetical protein ABI686_00745 [Acidobacteriota bacterium]
MENNKQTDVLAILKLYEMRREEHLRSARRWFYTEFSPEIAGDIAKLVLSGENESAYYRTVTSYWEMACSFVNNGGLDEKLFSDANSEHFFIFAKLQPFLPELRELFSDPNYNGHLEKLVMKTANVEEKLERLRKLMTKWSNKKPLEMSEAQ